MTDSLPAEFKALASQLKALGAEINAMLPALVEARRTYMRTRSVPDKAEMVRLESFAQELGERHTRLYDELKRASGLPDELLEAIDHPHLPSDGIDRRPRENLVRDMVETTGLVDDHIAGAIDTVCRIVPKEWLGAEDHSHQLADLANGRDCLSLVKGLRPESEFPTLHRLRQMIRVGQDYLTNNSAYDQFAGATLVPQLSQFGIQFENLKQVGGSLDERLRRLWDSNGAAVDASIFELLVAARCVEKGRRVEFIDEGTEKTPDIRCHDPFPVQIECKRKRVLSDYELAEEQLMRQLFFALELEAKMKGLWGRFELFLTVEANAMPVQEIVVRMISQRLAPHPERHTDYPWGSVAFVSLPHRIDVEPTRMYSPQMLRAVFNWNSDLPDWDGIVCRLDGGGDFDVDRVSRPIGLVWRNVTRKAVQRRAWSPVDLFGDATNQITPGEFGIIYLAYHEGARAEVADERLQRFFDRVTEWEHAGSIRIPISFLVRLYPRPLDHGVPDLIESTIRLCSGVYGDPRLFEDFPNSIFTMTP
ncbi:MAG: hypothetical protein ACOY5F_18540 [Pseudomonadota bacterium]